MGKTKRNNPGVPHTSTIEKPAETDLDRLHSVVSGEISGDGCGDTFAACHELAGVVETGQAERIICVTTSHNDPGYLIPMIEAVFLEHEIEYEIVNRKTSLNKEFLVGDTRIVFMTQKAFEGPKGLGLEAAYVYMTHNNEKCPVN